MYDSFNFCLLPLLVQQDIMDLIVANNPPSEALNLGITSKHCLTLFQRSKPRKEIKNFVIVFYDSYCDCHFAENSKPKKFTSAKTVNEFLKQVCIVDSVTINWNQAIHESFFPKIWMEFAAAIKFTKTVLFTTIDFDDESPKLLVEFFSRLPNCDDLKCIGRRTEYTLPISEIIEVLRKHRRLTFMRSNEADDEFLDALAEKTSIKNPLESLCIFSRTTFTPEGVMKFLQKTIFTETSSVSLTPLSGTAEEYLNAFKTWGIVENIPSQNAFVLKNHKTTLTFFFPIEIQIPENPSHSFLKFGTFWKGLSRFLPSHFQS